MDSMNKKLIFAYRDDKLGQGDVVYCWQPGCKWLAFCGDTRVVIIVDRLGKKVVEFPLKLGGKVKQMEFDYEGDTIALIQEYCSIVTIINIHTKKILEVDIDKSNKDKPTCIRWGKNHSILGIGTQIGLIYYYNKKSDKIYPLSFNHNKAVTTADWNDEGNLATGDENSSLSVTNKQGEPILQNATLKSDPKMIKWARQKTNDNKNSYTTISTVLNNRTILIYDIKKKSNPIELALDSDYGNIVTYQWFGDGYIAIGFSKGYISIISTHMNEIKNEVHSMQPFKTGLDDLCVCEEVNRIAIAGENSVKIYDTNLWSEIVEEKIEISNQAGRISKIQWSTTGHILIISTYLGSIFAFNVIVNDVFAVHKNNFSTLWSLNEATTYEIQQNSTQKIYQIQLFEEPKSLSISSNHLVANYGTKIQIFNTESIRIKDKGANEVKPQGEGILREFQSLINLICLNKEHIAILSEGRVHFAKIESETAEKIFPLKDTDDQILYVCLTENLIIYSDSNNKVKVYNIIDNYANIGEFRFDNPVKKIFPNQNGTKYLCIDNLGKGFLYNPINESVISINNEFEFLNIIWDSQDQNTFAAYTRSNQIYTYFFVESSLEGPKVNIIKDYAYLEEIQNTKISPYCMKLDSGCYPFYLNNGFLYYYAKNTKEIKGIFLLSHYWIFNWRDSNDTDDGHKKYFMQNYQLGRYWNCMKAIAYIKNRQEDYYDCLGKESLKNLNIDVAEESFRRAKNTSLVLTVEKLRGDNEKKILLGHIASILGEESKAQDLFTDSSKPEYALDLRIDLQDWNIALKLAKDFKPYKESFISRKIAYQNETNGMYAEALKLYEKSLIVDIAKFIEESGGEYDKDDINDHNTQCYAGIARCAFRLGDTTRGLSLAQELLDKNLILEIASLCENLNFPLEAASLYQQTNMFEKAATIFIQMKHFKSAEALIDKIKSPKLLQQLARMKEAEKLYKDAESAYELAGDWESVIRINLKYLDNPIKARDILMLRCKTETAALMMSDYYESKGKKKETIEFKLIAKRFEEAFTIAQSYNEMDTYAEFFMKDNKNIEEFKKIAQYYEGKNMFGKSGLFYEKSGNYQKALRMYIKGMNDEYLEKAVEMVGNVKDNTLINELIEYFLTSSFENGPHYLTRLYVLLGNYKQACDIAINLAAQEQELSNYKNAHHFLLDLYKDLKERHLPVANELNHRLSVLHSYILAKKYIVSKQHMKAARNLLRVANNITMFEKDIVNILTTVVIECAEVGLNKSASQYALVLMNDKYKNFIKDAYRSKIDKISRRAYKQEEEPMQQSSPCPFCSQDVPDYNLNCDSCMNIIPFCIGSGRHLTLNDLITCPHCQFPCIKSEMLDLLKNDRLCPMCDCEIDSGMLVNLHDPIMYIKSRKIAAFDSKDKGKDKEDQVGEEKNQEEDIKELDN